MFNLEIIEDIKNECKSRTGCGNCPYDTNLNGIFGLCDYIFEYKAKIPCRLTNQEIFEVIKNKSKSEMVHELENE